MCFGGGGGSRETTTQTQQILSPEQRALLQPVIPIAQDFLRQPPELFPGSGIAGFNPTQLQAQQQALGAGQVQGGVAQQGANASNFLLSPEALSVNTNPALQDAISAAVRPIFEGLGESALPNVRAGARNSGQFGGSRQGIAEGRAISDAFRQAGDTGAQVANQGFQSQLAAQTAALGQLPGTTATQTGQAQTTSAVGDQQRALEQAQLSEMVQRFAAEQTIPFNAAQQVAQLAFGAPGGATASQSLGPATGPSGLNTALGIASLIAGLFGRGA